MAMTDWIRFAELVTEMGQLIDAGQVEGPELERVLTEADAVLQGSEPVTEALDETFLVEDPWVLLKGNGATSSAASSRR